MNCRNCKNKLKNIFVDLGKCPPSNSLIKNKRELYFEKKSKLLVYVCEKCWLVQTKDVLNKKVFFNNKYPYLSSTSSSWVNHAKKYVEKVHKSLKLSKDSLVVELASNDGYLLQFFKNKNIPCFGIEPSKNTSKIAKMKKIKTIDKFFSYKLSKDINKKASLIIGNNVFAHVPNPLDFTKGMKELLKEKGTITLEFPHLMNLIKFSQFDTIYHEHFSYYNLFTVKNIFKKFNLKIYNVERLKTHGGSLRVYGCHSNDSKKIQKNVNKIINEEIKFGLQKLKTYKNFNLKVLNIKNKILNFIKKSKKNSKVIHAYGAAAKGSTILNFLNLSDKEINCVYDASKSKINKLIPGCHIKIISPKNIIKNKPDFIIIFPWNIKKEIMKNFKFIKKWGGKFITLIPNTKIYS